jgi:hypothetical protein
MRSVHQHERREQLCHEAKKPVSVERTAKRNVQTGLSLSRESAGLGHPEYALMYWATS